MVNLTNGNIEFASRLYGNTLEVAAKNYYTGLDLDVVRVLLEAKKKCS